MLESNCDVLISTMLNCVGLAKVVYGGLGCLVLTLSDFLMEEPSAT